MLFAKKSLIKKIIIRLRTQFSDNKTELVYQNIQKNVELHQNTNVESTKLCTTNIGCTFCLLSLDPAQLCSFFFSFK